MADYRVTLTAKSLGKSLDYPVNAESASVAIAYAAMLFVAEFSLEAAEGGISMEQALYAILLKTRDGDLGVKWEYDEVADDDY